MELDAESARTHYTQSPGLAGFFLFEGVTPRGKPHARA